jgi:nucleoside-diphosphate-sugar epimerase
METVLVTGGSGFIGSWCVIELLQRGYAVRTTVRSLAREDDVRAAIGGEVDAGDRLTVMAADLKSDDGWPEAVAGCDYVLHVASPFPPETPKDPDELIVPARDGALRVIRASLDAGARRVVMTSSTASVAGAHQANGRPLTEEDWTDPESPAIRPYVRSKAVAERAAWDLVGERDARDRLATILPGAVLGPVLSNDFSYSVQLIERLLNRSMPGVPRLGYSIVDARDVADMHIRAMTAPEAGGERFLATGPFLWIGEIAQVLHDRLGEAGSRVPTRRIPSFVVRGAALFDPGLKQVVGDLGREIAYSNDKPRQRLGWEPRPVEETIVDTANSLIAHGVVSVPEAAPA